MSDAAETEPLPPGRPAAANEGLGRRLALVAYHGGDVEMAVLSPDAPVVVGRATPANLVMRHASLSREHARFLLSSDRVTVEDLGSTNGTWIADHRVSRAHLEIGDEVMLGAVAVRIHALGPSGESLGIEGEQRFHQALEEELARALQFRRTFALLVVRVAREAGRWLERVRAELRPVDRITTHGPDAVQVLLPETGHEEALRIARAMAAPPREGEPQLLVGVAFGPEASRTAEGLIELARAAAGRASAGRPLEQAPAATWRSDEIAGGDAPVAGERMRPVLETADQVAATRIPVILLGETGTGKEVLARYIHDHGPRRSRRLVGINCGAIPANLVESTLFGHERGAFTGAVQQQRGAFEEAHGGTIFLDEIGEIPLAAQVALLRVLETGTFSRVGSNRELTCDARVIAATHQDLEAMAQAGTFRSDLYYRLNGITLALPPLRERTDEVEPLARRFLQLANKANGRDVRDLEPEALDLLKAYPWPGNLRELKNAIERAVVVARGATVGPRDLPARVQAARGDVRHGAEPKPPSGTPPDDTGGVKDRVQQYEARLLLDALEATGWNRAEAARRLDMPVRTLSHRMKVLGIKKP